MSKSFLPYDPGVLPTCPAPAKGDEIVVEVIGWPPIKDLHASIRNIKHPMHPSFVALRKAATEVMAGRAWVFGAVALELTIRGSRAQSKYSLGDYAGGVADTLDGSSGFTFTYLPIVFEDDCQISDLRTLWEEASEPSYRVHIIFK